MGKKVCIFYRCSDNSHVKVPHFSGYPGDMIVFAKFTLSPNSGALNIEFWGTSTKKTPINLAHHMYFNLAGHGAGIRKLINCIVYILHSFVNVLL